jgi:hypothetical protein
MNYSQLKDTWSCPFKRSLEEYEAPVTLSLPEWRDYVASGKNTLYAGAIIPGGTEQVPWGGGGAVYSGHVRQGGW